MIWLTAHVGWLILAVIAALILAVPCYLLADAIRGALRRWRAGRGDAFAQACALTMEPDPTPLPADFLLWTEEMESTP